MDNITPSDLTQCDRVALYGMNGGRTREYPVRGGKDVPPRFTDRTGTEWVLLSVIACFPNETVDQAILREIRQCDAEMAALLDEMVAA
jgi:hypothetical protein